MRIKLLLAGLVFAASALSQDDIPDKFENLKVLPKDITKPELLSTMKSFSLGLGVRCQHCHVGKEGEPLSTFNFKSDEKKTKDIARIMLQMVNEINGDFLTRIGRDEHLTVKCVTCHRGQARPILTPEALEKAYSEGGIDAALKKYWSLRTDYYGTHTYDFSRDALNEFADTLSRQQKFADAAKVLELNVKEFPDSVMTSWRLAATYMNAGEKDRALAQLRATMSMDNAGPFMEFLKKQLVAFQAAP